MAIPADNEEVCIQWLKTLDGIPSDGVGDRLPQDNSTWEASGFITVEAISGSPDIYLPEKHPIFHLLFWANRANSQRIPWGKANNLAELLIRACEVDNHTRYFGHLTMPDPYENVRVLSGYALTEPRKVTADEGRFACYEMDFQMHWCRVEE